MCPVGPQQLRGTELSWIEGGVGPSDPSTAGRRSGVGRKRGRIGAGRGLPSGRSSSST